MKKYSLKISNIFFILLLISISDFLFLFINTTKTYAQSSYTLDAQADFTKDVITGDTVQIVDSNYGPIQFDQRKDKKVDLYMNVPALFKTLTPQNTYGYPDGTGDKQPQPITDIEIVGIYSIGSVPKFTNIIKKGPNTCPISLQYNLRNIEQFNVNNSAAIQEYDKGKSNFINFFPKNNTFNSNLYTVLARIFVNSGEKIEINNSISAFNVDEAKLENTALPDYIYINPTGTPQLIKQPQAGTPSDNTYDLFSTATTLSCKDGKFSIAQTKGSQVESCSFQTVFVGSTDIFNQKIPGVKTPIGCLPGNFSGAVSVIMRIFIGISGAIALIFIIVAGINIVNNTGDTAKIKENYSLITKSVTGLFIIILASFILSVIGLKILDIPSLGGVSFQDIFSK